MIPRYELSGVTYTLYHRDGGEWVKYKDIPKSILDSFELGKKVGPEKSKEYYNNLGYDIGKMQGYYEGYNKALFDVQQEKIKEIDNRKPYP